MPAGRVLATQQARDAAKQLLALTGSVKDKVGRVLQQGSLLADPAHWGGGLAGKWRNDWGPDTNQLNQATAKLDELEHRAQLVIDDIFKADSAPGSAGVALATYKSPPPPQAKEKDHGLLGDIGGFFKSAADIKMRFDLGVWDGAVGFVTGLGGLIGRDPTTGRWSWSAAGTAWGGLGKFALALNPEALIVDQTVGVPGLERGELGNTLLNAGKGLIAYDEWGKDPARAAGTATFNVAAAVLGTKGAGAGLRAAGAAVDATRVARAAADAGGAAETAADAADASGAAETDAADAADASTEQPPFDAPPEISGGTAHGEGQMLGRDGGYGVNDEAANDAVSNPVKPPRYVPDKYGGTYRYVGKDATVCLNKDGQVTTAWANNSTGWRNP